MAIDRNAPHDSLVKELLGAPNDAAALLQTVLPHEICAAIDWASLERDDRELAAPQGARTHTDLLSSGCGIAAACSSRRSSGS